MSDKGIPRKTIYVAQEITVGETRGRGAGSSAHFHVQYTFKRVVPPEYGFYKTIKQGGNGLLIFSIICSLWQLISIAIIHKKIKETRAIKANIVKAEREKQEKERQEQIKRKNEIIAALAKKNEEERRIYSERREASIKSLLGSDYEGAVRIPDDISFASDGKPIKGHCSKNAPYGQYSVYITSSGKCYHNTHRCCHSNYRTVHVFDVIHQYKPCSKCVSYQRVRAIPEWYKMVLEIQRKS